jgi:Ran GTPase-activating protein 1
MSCID